MEVIEAICSRKSIRTFSDQPVPKEILEKVLAAAMYAPSAYDQRPWIFIVVDDKKLLKEVPKFHPHAVQAPLGILVCSDMNRVEDGDFWVLDCSCATQNLLLGIHDQGLGSVWTGVFPREKIVLGFRSLLNIPKEIIPFSFVMMGYSAEKVEKKAKRFQERKIHRGEW